MRVNFADETQRYMRLAFVYIRDKPSPMRRAYIKRGHIERNYLLMVSSNGMRGCRAGCLRFRTDVNDDDNDEKPLAFFDFHSLSVLVNYLRLFKFRKIGQKTNSSYSYCCFLPGSL